MLKEIMSSEKAICFSSKPIEDVDYLSESLSIDKITLLQYPNWHIINGELYYFKEINDSKRLFNELLGVQLAKFFRLPTIEYSLGIKEEDYSIKAGLLSKVMFDPTKEYKNLFEIVTANAYGFVEQFCLRDVIALCKTSQQKKRVFLQILKMSMLDFYSHQVDRTFPNINIQISPNVALGPIFDYSETFDVDFFKEERRYTFPCNMDWYETGKYVYQNDFIKLTFPSPGLKELFETYPQVYAYFLKILKIDILKCLARIQKENDIKIPYELIDYYLDYDIKQKHFVRRINDGI